MSPTWSPVFSYGLPEPGIRRASGTTFPAGRPAGDPIALHVQPVSVERLGHRPLVARALRALGRSHLAEQLAVWTKAAVTVERA
jgi:hypothetical protein